jgi:amino acid adenylation domain-containing protein
MIKGFEAFPRTALSQSIPARFETIVQRFPQKLAVHTSGGGLTYLELNGRANQVSQAIQNLTGSTAEPIALAVEHDADAVAAILGILKSGNFYTVLDRTLAREKLANVLAELAPRLIIADRNNWSLAQELAGERLRLLNIDGLALTDSRARTDCEISSGATAYAFCTSGTTGKPKIIMDSHRNVLHNILRYTNTLRIHSEDRLTLLQDLSFSGSVSSLFSALLNGATAFPYDLRRQGTTLLADWLEQNRITIYHSVPSIFRLIATEGKKFHDLRIIRLEGDQTSVSDVESFQKNFFPSCVLVNGLGATECGLIRQFFVSTTTPITTPSVPIGYAVEDMDVMVVDDGARPLPAGEIGEIAVKSRFLATGYWKQETLTAQKFLPVPNEPEARVYRTGDLGRFLPDNCLEYLGRKHFEARIRGQTINLTEIESELLQVAGVREAVVLTRTDASGENQLVAYFTAKEGCTLSSIDLRQALSGRLAKNCSPACFICLQALPLNANGKIDRRKLTESAQSLRSTGIDATPARDSVEANLIAIWKDVLELDEVGVHDSFLDLGGDSLQMMRMLNRLRQHFGRVVPFDEFFRRPTIASLSEWLR